MKQNQSTILIPVSFYCLRRHFTVLVAGNEHQDESQTHIRPDLILTGCLAKYLSIGNRFIMGLTKQEESMKSKYLAKFVLAVACLIIACVQMASLVPDPESRQAAQQLRQTSNMVSFVLETEKEVGVCHYASSNKYQYLQLPAPAAEAHKSHQKDIVGARSVAACPKEKSGPTSPASTEVPETPEPKSTSDDGDDVTPIPGVTKTSRAPTNAPGTKIPPVTNVPSTSIPDSTKTPVVIQTIPSTPVPPTSIHTALNTPVVAATQTPRPTVTTRPPTKETRTEATPGVSVTTTPAVPTEIPSLQDQLAIEQALLAEARSENESLSAERQQIAESLRVAESALAISEGDNSLLVMEVQRLRMLLTNLEFKKALNGQQIADLEKTIGILERAIAADEAQREEAFWTKVGAIVAFLIGALTIVFATWKAEIRFWLMPRQPKGDAPSEEEMAVKLKSIFVPSSVERGDKIPLQVSVAQGVTCQPTLTYPSLTRRQLEAKHAIQEGSLSWELLIDPGKKPGKWKVRFQCFPSGEYEDVEFVVI